MSRVCSPSPMPRQVAIPPRGVDYRGKVVLAPMVRSGELPSRLTALHYGADLVWGPETVDRAIIGTTRRVNPATNVIEWVRCPHYGQKTAPADAAESVIFQVDPREQEPRRRLIYQIGTADPERAVAATRLVAGDVAGIDVNAGCPKPFSTLGGMGAALLRSPDKLCDILRALVATIVPEFGIGISVKIRLLETPGDTEALVRRLCATGITGLTVHCRTTPMRPRERAIRDQLCMVTSVCRDAGVACLMNGDVTSRDEALELARMYGADGAMIATAAETNPSCFRTAAQGGLATWLDAVEVYVKFCLETRNRFGNTKYLLGRMIPGRKPEFKAVTQAKSYTQLVRVLGLEERFEDQARVVDLALNIDPELGCERKKKPQKRKNNESTNDSSACDGNQVLPKEAKRQRREAVLIPESEETVVITTTSTDKGEIVKPAPMMKEVLTPDRELRPEPEACIS